MPLDKPAADLITLDDIERTRAGLPDVVRRTPILPLARDSAEVGNEALFLKCENLQVTGAYKVRAAFAVMNALTPEQRAKGLVLASSGNFAQAFAYAGALTGTPIVIVMLDRASPYKVEATRGYGAEVVFCGNDALSRQPTVEKIGRERGMTAIDTWEERPIAMGHGSIGLEIVEDMPLVETVLVPVSSGGVAAGIAAAVKLRRPDVRVVGVQPENANAAYVSMQRGEPTTINHWDSIADGLSAVRPGAFPFRHLQTFMDEIVLVSERDIAVAFRTLLFRSKILAEPAGAVAAAAFLSGRVPQDRRTVAAVTGGNVTEAMVAQMLEMAAED
ncbi:threonine dehydratase [Constrictibacter sp. MBR-5]|jgi:threonine dehydratase|uniref:pyridoxal-phosphate dependent enzyme n=1 Tax=Constrictibacter sp. MBR-5 TaxID=3156467 RepID=UPI0033951B3E